MSLTVVSIIVCLSYLIESIFGFGGTVIALAALGIFYDFKEMIPLAIYASLISSSVIILSDYKSIDLTVLKKIFPFVAVGTIAGAAIFYVTSGEVLMRLFAAFIIYNSYRTLFSKPLHFTTLFKRILLFLGGIVHGMFGTGGPIILMAIKDSFYGKSNLRASMAVVFLVFNILRISHLYFFTDFPMGTIFEMWWLVFPLTLSILIGYKIHLSVSEKVFSKGLSILLLIVAIKFFL